MKPLFSRHVSPRAAIGIGALVLIVSFLGGREKPDTQAHAAPAPQRGQAPPALSREALDPASLKREARNEPVGDLFPAPVMSPPAGAPMQADPRPIAPVAPPLPFRYLGKAVEQGSVTVFLGRGDEHYRARNGERIGSEYRVDRVTEKAVAFTYLPLKARQTLSLPSSEPISLE